MSQPVSDQQIIDCLKSNYHLNVISLAPLPWGADMNAHLYKAETENQSSYFLKLKLGCQHDMGPTILELLNNAKIQQIILPIKTIHGESTFRLGDFTLIVSPFIKGQNGFVRKLTDEEWQIFGRILRKIHEIDVPSSIKKQLRQETYSPKWRISVRSLYGHLETKPTGDEISIALHGFMKANISTIHQLVDRAEQLAGKLHADTHKQVLCHSDIHGGNILIAENHDIYLIDWDDSIMAPKECDLMFIGGGVGNVWNDPFEERLFYKGYGKTEINKTILSYYRHERIVEDIALLAQQLLLSTAGGEDRATMYQHFIGMFKPKGVVEMAFKTDEES